MRRPAFRTAPAFIFLARWPRPSTLVPMDNPLLRAWRSLVAEAPGEAAVTEALAGRTWTRGELAAGAARMAAVFRTQVPKPSRRRIALALPNGAAWFEAFIGLLEADAVPVPIDPSEPEAAQIEAARFTGATHFWRDSRFESVPGSRHRATERPLCLVKLTSGSTGKAKGLPATFGQMEADGRQICATMGILPGDSNLATIPLGYSYGLGNLVVPLLLQGTRVICASSPLPHALAENARTYRPTLLPTVPPILKALAASELPKGCMESVRLVISAGSPLDPKVAQAFRARFGIRIHGFYGASETGGIAYDRSGAATLEGRGVGTALEGVRLQIGARGHLTVSSRAVLGRGVFSPADRVAMNAHGELVLLGRADRAVKLAGRRVDLAEVERVIRSLEGVADCYVDAHPGGASAIAAAVVGGAPPAAIRSALRLRLASWKVPARILVFAQFPVTARGKTDFAALRQALSAPRTATSISTLSADRQIAARR